MKAVILAGGLGTRLSEETELKPKPMVIIGSNPILWHIMKIYSNYGINDFIICCGYKGHIIKEYFANYFMHSSDVTYNLLNNEIKVHQNYSEPWKVTLVDTGQDTKTGGRLKRIGKYLKEDDTFCFTYGDGVADVNINDLIKFHQSHGKLATLTATRPPGRYGALKFKNDDGIVSAFKEKPDGDNSWINGGFFVLSNKVLNMIDGDETSWEEEPLNNLASIGQLCAYKHDRFWQPMDTIREKAYLNDLWEKGQAPWKIWE